MTSIALELTIDFELNELAKKEQAITEMLIKYIAKNYKKLPVTSQIEISAPMADNYWIFYVSKKGFTFDAYAIDMTPALEEKYGIEPLEISGTEDSAWEPKTYTDARVLNDVGFDVLLEVYKEMRRVLSK